MRSRIKLLFALLIAFYFTSVVNRSSMGVASLNAAERFETSATQLALITVSQLIVYAALQIPVGVLVDRFGPRSVLLSGLFTVGFGQLIVAFSHNLAGAIVGRMVLGFGDAFIFISMIRAIQLISDAQLVTRRQLLATNLGQLGQLVSAVPFGSLLRNLGWEAAFSIIGAAALCLSFLGVFLLDIPKSSSGPGLTTLAAAIRGVRTGLSSPFVRMAFWTHFTLQSASSIFLLLWGFPYLVEVQGFTAPQASWFLGLLVVFALIFGRVTGYLATRLPHRRSTLVIVSTAAVVLMWMVLLANPGPDAFAAVVCLGLVLSAAATVSILAFDFTRKNTPETQLGVANGITNIGGFLATLSAVFLVGLVTDSASISGPRFDASQLEIGLWILPGTALFGLIFFVLEDKKARKVLSPGGREYAFFMRGLRKKPNLHQK